LILFLLVLVFGFNAVSFEVNTSIENYLDGLAEDDNRTTKEALVNLFIPQQSANDTRKHTL
jgi:hypothetical protein